MSKKLLVWLGKPYSDDAALVGEKAKNLSELVRLGLPVLNGFVVTTTAYQEFVEHNSLTTKIQHLQASLTGEKLDKAIEKELSKAKLPQSVVDDILKAYIKLAGHIQQTSFTLTSSFSNQSISVKGEANLLIEIKNLYVETYRKNPTESISILVQLEALPEKKGVVHTDNPDMLSMQLSPKAQLEVLEGINNARKHFFLPQTFSWITENDNLYITDVKEILHSKESVLGISPHTATKIYVNIDDYKNASAVAKEHVDGVGLLRYEDLMNENTVHPKTFLDKGKKDEYINDLAKKIASVCAVFSPRCVMYKPSSLTTSDYGELENGKEYESKESNPMLGHRGAHRFMQDQELFLLEMDAIKQVRNKMGHKNIWLALPFVRSVSELQEIKKLIASNGLYRSPTFKIFMMVEIPSNVILLDEFIEQGIDGVVIQPHMLTTLLTGTDKDNRDVMSAYHEDNKASLWAYEHIIKIAHKHKILSSYYGQKEGIQPTLLEKLVLWGVSSISIFPESIDIARQYVAQFEKEKGK